jgi:hypothetical protein
LLYDKDAKGFLGWWRNLGRPRPTAPYQWENTGRVVVIGDAYVWVTDISLSQLDTKVYFVSVNEGPVVCGRVIRLTPNLRLVSVPLGHTIHKQDFVTTDRPHGFTGTP